MALHEASSLRGAAATEAPRASRPAEPPALPRPDLTPAELWAEHEKRIEDIAILVERLEARKGSELQALVQTLEADKAGLEASLREMRARCAALTRERDALRASTSWRITGPLRAIKDAVTRRGTIRKPPEKATATR